MTKFVMNSGGLKTHEEKAKAYFAELLEGLGETPELLWCFFATLPDDCDVRFEKYIKLFEPYMPKGVHPVHKNAKVSTFEEQVKQADVIYMHGGSIAPLYEVLEKFDVLKLFEGKSVGTNSASSMVLAKHTWSCDERELVDGLGVFQIKFMAHYNADYGVDDERGPVDWGAAYKELKNHGDTALPMFALEEGEFMVMKK